MHPCDHMSKQQSFVWNSPVSPTPNKVEVVPSAGKVMIIQFLDVQETVKKHTISIHKCKKK